MNNLLARLMHHACGALALLALFGGSAFGQNANDGFDPDANGPVWAIAVQADGKIVIGGEFSRVGGAYRNNLARLNIDGSVDAAFNPGPDGGVFSLALQSDGK